MTAGQIIWIASLTMLILIPLWIASSKDSRNWFQGLAALSMMSGLLLAFIVVIFVSEQTKRAKPQHRYEQVIVPSDTLYRKIQEP